MRVSQNGNTANNGFHNALILNDSPQLVVVGRPSCAGIKHAFSQPAWDIIPHSFHLDPISPAWSSLEGEINNRYSTLRRYPVSTFDNSRFSGSPRTYQQDIAACSTNSTISSPINLLPVGEPSSSKNLPSTKRTTRIRKNLSFLKGEAERLLTKTLECVAPHLHSDIHIVLGNATPRISIQRQATVSTVVLEHGQIRWIAKGSDCSDRQQQLFFETCKRASHIWLTNVDQASLNIADQYFSHKWSVLPHPYVLDDRAPYEPMENVRREIMEELKSSFLILNPSSISIGGDQRKGTDKLLNAVANLRDEHNIRAGVIFVRWGADVPEAEALIKKLGLSDQCRFVNPLTRVALQKFMASFDLISDQFDYDAFGALTIRTLEQGMPLLSRPIGDLAAKYIGGRPPVVEATTTDEISTQLLALWNKIESVGRPSFLEDHRLKGRNWLLRRHHHWFTRELQVERYNQLQYKSPPPAVPGRWGQLPDWSQ